MKKVITGILFIPALAWGQETVELGPLQADWYPADGETAVIVLHGTLAHKRMEIIQTFSELLNEDYDVPVLAPNLALNEPDRTGMVNCDLVHDHTHMDAVDEISQWVSYLETQGYSKIALLAHSRGGAQLAKYLQGASDSVTAAGLVAPATYDAADAAERYQQATSKSLNSVLNEARSMSADATFVPPRFVYCENAEVTAQAFLGYHAPNSDFDTPTLLQSVSIPTQVYIGSEDDVVSDLAEKLDASGFYDQGDVIVVDGADHFFRDLYADDVISEFTSFIGY